MNRKPFFKKPMIMGNVANKYPDAKVTDFLGTVASGNEASINSFLIKNPDMVGAITNPETKESAYHIVLSAPFENSKKLSICRLLKRNNISPLSLDSRGESVMSLAIKTQDPDIVELITHFYPVDESTMFNGKGAISYAISGEEKDCPIERADPIPEEEGAIPNELLDRLSRQMIKNAASKTETSELGKLVMGYFKNNEQLITNLKEHVNRSTTGTKSDKELMSGLEDRVASMVEQDFSEAKVEFQLDEKGNIAEEEKVANVIKKKKNKLDQELNAISADGANIYEGYTKMMIGEGYENGIKELIKGPLLQAHLKDRADEIKAFLFAAHQRANIMELIEKQLDWNFDLINFTRKYTPNGEIIPINSDPKVKIDHFTNVSISIMAPVYKYNSDPYYSYYEWKYMTVNYKKYDDTVFPNDYKMQGMPGFDGAKPDTDAYWNNHGNNNQMTISWDSNTEKYTVTKGNYFPNSEDLAIATHINQLMMNINNPPKKNDQMRNTLISMDTIIGLVSKLDDWDTMDNIKIHKKIIDKITNDSSILAQDTNQFTGINVTNLQNSIVSIIDTDNRKMLNIFQTALNSNVKKKIPINKFDDRAKLDNKEFYQILNTEPDNGSNIFALNCFNSIFSNSVATQSILFQNSAAGVDLLKLNNATLRWNVNRSFDIDLSEVFKIPFKKILDNEFLHKDGNKYKIGTAKFIDSGKIPGFKLLMNKTAGESPFPSEIELYTQNTNKLRAKYNPNIESIVDLMREEWEWYYNKHFVFWANKYSGSTRDNPKYKKKSLEEATGEDLINLFYHKIPDNIVSSYTSEGYVYSIAACFCSPGYNFYKSIDEDKINNNHIAFITVIAAMSALLIKYQSNEVDTYYMNIPGNNSLLMLDECFVDKLSELMEMGYKQVSNVNMLELPLVFDMIDIGIRIGDTYYDFIDTNNNSNKFYNNNNINTNPKYNHVFLYDSNADNKYRNQIDNLLQKLFTVNYAKGNMWWDSKQKFDKSEEVIIKDQALFFKNYTRAEIYTEVKKVYDIIKKVYLPSQRDELCRLLLYFYYNGLGGGYIVQPLTSYIKYGVGQLASNSRGVVTDLHNKNGYFDRIDRNAPLFSILGDYIDRNMYNFIPKSNVHNNNNNNILPNNNNTEWEYMRKLCAPGMFAALNTKGTFSGFINKIKFDDILFLARIGAHVIPENRNTILPFKSTNNKISYLNKNSTVKNILIETPNITNITGLDINEGHTYNRGMPYVYTTSIVNGNSSYVKYPSQILMRKNARIDEAYYILSVYPNVQDNTKSNRNSPCQRQIIDISISQNNKLPIRDNTLKHDPSEQSNQNNGFNVFGFLDYYFDNPEQLHLIKGIDLADRQSTGDRDLEFKGKGREPFALVGMIRHLIYQSLKKFLRTNMETELKKSNYPLSLMHQLLMLETPDMERSDRHEYNYVDASNNTQYAFAPKFYGIPNNDTLNRDKLDINSELLKGVHNIWKNNPDQYIDVLRQLENAYENDAIKYSNQVKYNVSHPWNRMLMLQSTELLNKYDYDDINYYPDGRKNNNFTFSENVSKTNFTKLLIDLANKNIKYPTFEPRLVFNETMLDLIYQQLPLFTWNREISHSNIQNNKLEAEQRQDEFDQLVIDELNSEQSLWRWNLVHLARMYQDIKNSEMFEFIDEYKPLVGAIIASAKIDPFYAAQFLLPYLIHLQLNAMDQTGINFSKIIQDYDTVWNKWNVEALHGGLREEVLSKAYLVSKVENVGIATSFDLRDQVFEKAKLAIKWHNRVINWINKMNGWKWADSREKNQNISNFFDNLLETFPEDLPTTSNYQKERLIELTKKYQFNKTTYWGYNENNYNGETLGSAIKFFQFYSAVGNNTMLKDYVSYILGTYDDTTNTITNSIKYNQSQGEILDNDFYFEVNSYLGLKKNNYNVNSFPQSMRDGVAIDSRRLVEKIASSIIVSSTIYNEIESSIDLYDKRIAQNSIIARAKHNAALKILDYYIKTMTRATANSLRTGTIKAEFNLDSIDPQPDIMRTLIREMINETRRSYFMHYPYQEKKKKYRYNQADKSIHAVFYSASHLASKKCYKINTQIVDLLIKKYPQSINRQDTVGQTALHDAVKMNHPGIIIKLRKSGAVSMSDKFNKTPKELHYEIWGDMFQKDIIQAATKGAITTLESQIKEQKGGFLPYGYQIIFPLFLMIMVEEHLFSYNNMGEVVDIIDILPPECLSYPHIVDKIKEFYLTLTGEEKDKIDNFNDTLISLSKLYQEEYQEYVKTEKIKDNNLIAIPNYKPSTTVLYRLSKILNEIKPVNSSNVDNLGNLNKYLGTVKFHAIFNRHILLIEILKKMFEKGDLAMNHMYNLMDREIKLKTLNYSFAIKLWIEKGIMKYYHHYQFLPENLEDNYVLRNMTDRMKDVLRFTLNASFLNHILHITDLLIGKLHNISNAKLKDVEDTFKKAEEYINGEMIDRLINIQLQITKTPYEKKLTETHESIISEVVGKIDNQPIDVPLKVRDRIRELIPFYAFLYSEVIAKMKDCFDGFMEHLMMQYQFILTAQALDTEDLDSMQKEVDRVIPEDD